MHYDYIIIGGGIIGCATAYYLQKAGLDKKILLIDQFDKVGQGNTARSAALYRNIFSSKTNQLLAESSIKFYKSLAGQLQVKENGYLWLLHEDQWGRFQHIIEDWDKAALRFQILERGEIEQLVALSRSERSRFPPVFRGLFSAHSGALSAPQITRYYAAQFEKLGGKIALRTKISSFHLNHKDEEFPPWKDIALDFVSDQNHQKYNAAHYVIASGSWSPAILIQLGIAPAVYPKRRQLFTLKLAHFSDFFVSSDPPNVILPIGGIYIKPIPQSKMIMVGCADHLGCPFQMGEFPPEASEDYFQNAINPVLAHYFPQVQWSSLHSKWAGYYAYHWPDANPVIESVSNITWVTGTSGSGIMKGDAIGRTAAAKIMGWDEVELYGNARFRPTDLSLHERKVEPEKFVL